MKCKNFDLVTLIALAVSKPLIKTLRLFKLGGTTLPGKIAMVISKNILRKLSQNLDRIILVTGTNGKTTTCRMIARLLSESNIAYFTNKSGANLLSGIASTLIENSSFLGNYKVTTALFEVDEAAFSKITNFINPNFIVITNFFRDQLDRYGELYTTVKNVQQGIEKTNNPVLIINADDSLSCSISKQFDKKTFLYGFENFNDIENNKSLVVDAVFCIFCKSKYSYKFRTFGHLGGFECPTCGFARQIPQVSLHSIKSLSNDTSEFTIQFLESSSKIDCKIKIPGLYNIYNALATSALGYAMEIPNTKIKTALEEFEIGFGRMENIEIDGKFVKIILVKNPIGFNQVISYLLSEDKPTNIAFVINDHAADGCDISWLWDVDFEKFEAMQTNVASFISSGTRANDMSVRLKYAGILNDKIHTCSKFDELIEFGLSQTKKNHNFYILPTYTAMLDIRASLSKKYNLKEFWK